MNNYFTWLWLEFRQQSLHCETRNQNKFLPAWELKKLSFATQILAVSTMKFNLGFCDWREAVQFDKTTIWMLESFLPKHTPSTEIRVWIAICILICFILFDAFMRSTASFRCIKTILLHAREGLKKAESTFCCSLLPVPFHLNFYVLAKSIFMNKCLLFVLCMLPC